MPILDTDGVVVVRDGKVYQESATDAADYFSTGGVTWGGITGVLENQDDLIAELDAKSPSIETVFTITGTTPEINPNNGTIQTWTLTGNSTPTANFVSGQGITLMIDDGSDFTITWPSVTWVNNGGNAPTLSSSVQTVIILWKVGVTLYGSLAGDGT